MGAGGTGKPGLFSNWHRNESLFRLLHYFLVFAAFELFAHYDRLPRPTGEALRRGLSDTFAHPGIVLVLLVWLAALTYRCAAWLRRRHDSLAVAIHPFWWLAAALLPFVPFLIMLVLMWRLTDQIVAEWQELNAPAPPAAPPGPDA